MKRLFLLLTLFGVLATGCEELLPNEQSPNATPLFSTDGESSYIVDAEGEEIAVMVTTNIDYSVVIPEDAEEWLSVSDTRALRVDTITFIVAPNNTTVERTTIVKFVDDNNNILQTISFTQNAATQSESVCPNNEIWYTNGSTTEATTPYYTNVFGANIVSNTYDAAKECWVIKFDGEVTTIGNLAFYEYSSLTSVTIPDSVTTIGDYAFYCCYSLTSVNIPDSVTTIGDYAFCCCDSLTSVNIPDSVTRIGEWAFGSCHSLTNVNIPDSVTTIGNTAFCDCTRLTSVNIPDSVTTIGGGAFASCDSLIEFTGKFAEDNGRILVIDGVLTAFAPAGITQYTIPDSVTTIGDLAFCGCTSLTSVNIPDSVTTIGKEAFSGCTSLTSVNIPDSVTSIGNYAFYWAESLTSVNIPDSVTSIGDAAFLSCLSLASVTIGDSVMTIGVGAFYACDSLTSVYCKAITPPALDWDVFDYDGSDRKIYVPAESVEAYKSAEGWSEYASDIVGYDF